MSRAPASSSDPEVWAVPVSESLICLWTLLPRAFEGVSIVLEDSTAVLWKKRRVLSASHRIHLFLFHADNVRSSARCTVAFRESKAKPETRFTTGLRLPEWRTPGVASAMRALLKALGEEDEPVAAGGLAQIMSAWSLWSVPCRYRGAEDGVSIAVSEFLPPAGELHVFALEAGTMRERSLTAVDHHADSCCLLWLGADIARAYADIDGDLVELRFEPPRAARDVAVSAWFAELPLEGQDRVLDAWSAVSAEEAARALTPFVHHVPSARSFVVGSSGVQVDAAFGLDDRLLLCATIVGEAAHLDIAVTLPAEAPVAASPLAEAPPDAPNAVAADRRCGRFFEVRCPHADAGPGIACLTISLGGVTRSGWIQVRRLDSAPVRRALHDRVAWERADQDLVHAFAEAIAAGDDAAASPTSIIDLCGRRDDGPLIVLPVDGDDDGLRASLLAIRLSVPDATVRLVCRGRLSSPEQLSRRALCQMFGGHVELVVTEAGEPVGRGLAVRPEDVESRPAIGFLQSGIAPVGADWWGALSREFRRSPDAIHWRPLTGAADILSAADYLVDAVPLVVAGPDVDRHVLTPRHEVFTFAGFVRHVLAAARHSGHLRPLEGVRLVRFGSLATAPDSYGDVRIDDAVVDAIVARGEGAQAFDPEAKLVVMPRARGERRVAP